MNRDDKESEVQTDTNNKIPFYEAEGSVGVWSFAVGVATDNFTRAFYGLFDRLVTKHSLTAQIPR